MRQRRLRHGGDDAGHTRQFVRQRFVEHDFARMGPFVRLQGSQPAIPLPWVQRLKVGFGKEVFVEHKVHPRRPEELQVGLDSRKPTVWDIDRQVVVEQPHAGSQLRVGALRMAEGGQYEVVQREVVEALASIGGNEFRVIG